MQPRLLYTSIRSPERSTLLQTAAQQALAGRKGEWTLCVVDAPRQTVSVVVLDGPGGWTGTWAFDHDDATMNSVRSAIEAELCARFDAP